MSLNRESFGKLCFCALFFSPAVLFTASRAFASLGQDVSSVYGDQVHVQGTLRTTQTQGYTVHEIHAANGVVMREFVSPAGKVFGIAWQGPWPPDLRQFLATYFDHFQQAAQAQVKSHPGRRALMIHEPGLVLESGGHVRDFAGRAYIPEMVPQGVSTDEIK